MIAQLQQASTHGSAEAQTTLGWMYYMGQGVPQDSSKAIGWWEKAAAQGDEKARQAIDIAKHG